MPATVIIGGQWGDEGKAKVVDYLMPDHDVVIRFQGGANAGHTVVTDQGKFAFHQIPSGVLYPDVTAILGNGMVIDPIAFLSELEELMSRGVNPSGRILISSAAHIVMQHHRILDNLYESDLEERSIGSTGKGIGPTYGDKHGRKSLRMSLFLLKKEEIFEAVKRRVEDINKLIEMYGAPAIDAEKLATDFINIRDLIGPMVVDTQEAIFRLKEQGIRIMLEGAQGTLLDIDHGTYPYVTSSSCTVGGALTGSGLTVKDIDRVIGIFKAYTTRVGNGPFPSELDDEIGDQLRERGGEYGTTTGRPRRCGWFDLVAARYAVRINGMDEIALTKLDVVSNIPEVNACTAYELDGERIDHFPHDLETLSRCKPVFEEFPGWELDPEAVHGYVDLPENARNYIEFLEEGMGVKATFISTGPERSSTILREAAISFDSKQ